MHNQYMIKNARVWTADRENPWADSLLISGKRLEAVGSYEDVKGKCPPDATVVDLKGRMVMPAILDSHIHAVATAKTMWCYLFERKDYKNIEEILEMVKVYAEENPKEQVPYIYAYSCPTHLMEGEQVNKFLLDKYVSDRPVLLCDENYHRCLVNSTMLTLMEIDKDTPYREDTACNYKRFEDGTPNGIIEERAHEFDHAIDKMFEKINWSPPSEADPDVLAPVLDRLTQYGVCGIHEGFTESEDTMVGLKALRKQGRLNHYVHVMPMLHKVEGIDETIALVKEWKAKYEDEYCLIDSIKFMLDGTNELGTGAVVEPFCSDPEDYGTLFTTEEKLTGVLCKLNEEGLSIQIHLVGDRAFRVALNAVEKAQAREREAGREFVSRVTLIHCELTHPDDRKRPARLGVFINFTPIWAGGVFGDASKKYLGEERFNSMYAFNEIIDSGAVVNFSSDIVDEEGLSYMNPFVGIEIGHTRLDEELVGFLREPKEECLTIEDLLRGYTINNAKGMGIAHRVGSLEEGKLANLLVLNKNIFEVPANEIKTVTPEVVMFEGKVVKGSITK